MRFGGNDGNGFPEWQSVKLGEVMDFKVTNSFSRENLNYENGTVKNIHYGDIHTKFQTLFDITKENVPYINEEISIDKILEDNYCKEGDIIFADASEDLNDVGKSIEIANLNSKKLLSGLHTLLARPKENIFHKGFNGYLFKSTNIRTQIQKEAQGTKVLSISAGRISKIVLTYPSASEQQKIASFLTLIDERIQTQNKIIAQLESLMQGLRGKLFKQQIRFKDENGNDFPRWEVKKLVDVCKEHQLKNSKKENNEVFSVAKHKGVINQIEHLGRSFSAKDIAHYKLIFPGDLVYTKSPTSDFPFGIIKQNRTGRIGVVSPLYCVFSPKTFALGYLLHEHFSSSINTFNYLNPLVQKGAKNTMNINNNDFLNGAGLLLPISEKEQTRIANFLLSIDKKIQTEKKVLDQYASQKKYLLQDMFI